MKKYALVSAYHKEGVVEFVQTLVDLEYKIISTGGTAKILKEHNIPIIPIQDITGNPESFDGRMKTISFEVESGILFDRKNKSHVAQAKRLAIKSIDIVVCNLYPFEETISDENVTEKKAVESIDVGGPTMIRSAAKNFSSVMVVTDPTDYKNLSELLRKKKVTKDVRRDLAAKAFAHLSFYDSQIAHYFSEESFPQEETIPGRKSSISLRYGENPHQKASMYFMPNTKSPLKNLDKKSGRELSLTNITDINAGVESVRLFQEPAAVIIKHNTPCGIALGATISTALTRAIESDPESAFGGVIVLNKTMTLKTARIIAQFKDERRGNIDIVSCPAIDKDALELLQEVRKTMGIYTFGKLFRPKNSYQYKWIDGGFVTQTADEEIEKSFKDWSVVTKAKPTALQLRQMEVGWKFVSRIKSNTIVIMDPKLPMVRAIGTGQTSRIRSTKIALETAGKFAKGAILVSDSFFPFDDSVRMAAEYKIGAIVQQGGSINDKASIEAANKFGIPMVFTHRRAFWH